MSVSVSSYIPTSGGTDARTAELLNFPFNARPQAMTFYLRFFELGTIATGGGYLFAVLSATDENPSLRLFVQGAAYRLQHVSAAGTAIAATMAAGPSVGDVTELVGQLNADGSILMIQSINGAAATETSASSALTMGDAWAAPTLYVATRGSGDQGSQNAFMNIVFVRGVHSLARMRRFAGVKQ